MSLAHDHKVNTIYKHATSIQDRAPAPELTPVQKLQKAQRDERDKMVKRHQREFEALNDKHNEARNDDPVYRNNMGVHDYVVQRETAEHDNLRTKNAQQRKNLAERHRFALERAFKQHGIAP